MCPQRIATMKANVYLCAANLGGIRPYMGAVKISGHHHRHKHKQSININRTLPLLKAYRLKTGGTPDLGVYPPIRFVNRIGVIWWLRLNNNKTIFTSMQNNSASNKRIAKNTLLLYLRTLLLMLISLYTSRVLLDVLGVDDYGIYNVVGGVVAMFSMISGSLSASISRFLTFELGRGDMERMRMVFSTSVNIQVVIAMIVVVLGEIVGGWFVCTYMNIPAERLDAAMWVLHCSLAMFCINLVSLPYNACIVAHEHMDAFAYVSILEALLKLSVCYLIVVSPFDKLKTYALLLAVVALIIRFVYGAYCKKHFAESKYKFVGRSSVYREMAGFAGWSFLTNACYLFNTQGVNILINLFFGVALNAARGIANQVDGIIMQFVNNFTMAINPQITKTYAAGQRQEMFKLVCRGAKFSYFLLLLIALPMIIETEIVLSLWLKDVPEYTVVFLRLTIVGSMFNMLGNTGYTACMATGNLRHYALVVSSVGILVFPLTWIAFECGLPAQSAYVAFIIVYGMVLFVRLRIMKGLVGFPPKMFVAEVIYKVLMVTVVAAALPSLLAHFMPESVLRLVVMLVVCTLLSCVSIYFMGLSQNERKSVSAKCMEIYHRIL